MHRRIRSDTPFPIGATGCVNFILLRRKEGLGLICCLTKTRSLNGLFKYLAASLSELKGSEEEVMDVVSEILAFVKRTKQLQLEWEDL